MGLRRGHAAGVCATRHASLVCLAGGAEHRALFLSDLRPEVRLHRRIYDGAEGAATTGRELLGGLSSPWDTSAQNLSRTLGDGDARAVGDYCHAAAGYSASERRRM